MTNQIITTIEQNNVADNIELPPLLTMVFPTFSLNHWPLANFFDNLHY